MNSIKKLIENVKASYQLYCHKILPEVEKMEN